MNRLPRKLLERAALALLLVGSVANAVAPPERYTKGNDTATDVKTGLTWQRAPYSLPLSWSLAGSHCDGLTLGGRSDWRLPSVAELETLTDVRETEAPFQDQSIFDPEDGNDATARYWSSTEVPGEALKAFAVGADSFIGPTVKLESLSVRCVRGGP